MVHRSLLFAGILLSFLAQQALATQADDTTITIDSENAGATPLIVQLTLSASDTTFLRSIQFTIAPRAGSVTRAFSQTYTASYLASRGYLIANTGQIFLPVYGLYADYGNSVTLIYYFFDGSSKQDSTTITTGTFTDLCGIIPDGSESQNRNHKFELRFHVGARCLWQR